MKKSVTIHQQNELLDALNSLAESSLFTSIKRQGVSRDWIESVRLSEMQTSSVLSWLLDPSQGHGLGDFVLRRLIQEARERSVESPEYDWHPIQLDQCSLGSSLVHTEVPVTLDDENRRIDILVTDPWNQISIIIERKTGAMETIGQLEFYKRWGAEVLQRGCGHHVLYVISGHARWLNDGMRSDGWAYLSDGWIAETLDTAIERRLVPPDINQQLIQLRTYVFGDWDENLTPFYKDLDSDTAKLRADIGAKIDTIKNATLKLDESTIRLADVSTQRLASDILPSSGGITNNIIAFYIKNRITLNALFNYAEVYVLEDYLEKSKPNTFVFNYYRRHNNTILELTPTGVDDIVKEGFWPAYLSIEPIPTGDAQSYGAFFYMRRLQDKDEHLNEITEKILQKHINKPSFGRRRYETVPLPYSGTLRSGDLGWFHNAASWLLGECAIYSGGT